MKIPRILLAKEINFCLLYSNKFPHHRRRRRRRIPNNISSSSNVGIKLKSIAERKSFVFGEWRGWVGKNKLKTIK